MKRLLPYVLVTVCSALLGLPTSSAAKNNLNLLPGTGYHYGIVKRGSSTISVTLERSAKGFVPDLNDNMLVINDVPADTADARPVFDGTADGIPFAVAFPFGAYELIDLGWGGGRELLSARGCVQQKAMNNGAWDSARVYCDKTGVEKINIAGSSGNDALILDPDVTATVRFKCHRPQATCGEYCLLPEDYTCCDPTIPGSSGCWVPVGSTCDAPYCLQ